MQGEEVQEEVEEERWSGGAAVVSPPHGVRDPSAPGGQAWFGGSGQQGLVGAAGAGGAWKNANLQQFIGWDRYFFLYWATV